LDRWNFFSDRIFSDFHSLVSLILNPVDSAGFLFCVCSKTERISTLWIEDLEAECFYDLSDQVGETIMAKANPIEIQKHLKGMNYPASREDIIQHAEEHGADEDLRSLLEELPEDEYETPADVNKAIGQIN
jgi:hypothetical protein